MRSIPTPGTLHVSKHATPDYAPQYGVHDGGSRDLATFHGEHAKENAHLFAAAPRMYEALDAIEEYLRTLDGFRPGVNSGAEGARVRGLVRDALSEARAT